MSSNVRFASVIWKYIDDYEKCKLTAYIPCNGTGRGANSGVTIATGVDLGQNNKYDLERMIKKNTPLWNKLFPFLATENTTLVGSRAIKALKDYQKIHGPNTPNISPGEAQILDNGCIKRKAEIFYDASGYNFSQFKEFPL